MKRFALGATGALLTVCAAWVVAQENLPSSPAGQPASPATVKQQYSYALGLDMGATFRSRETPLDLESLLAGLKDGLSDAKPKYDQETCGKALRHMQTLMAKKEMAQQELAGAENKKLGDAFLAQNKAKPGVKVTKSGLQYKVVKPGTGATPRPTDTVKCNYRGTLIDGTVFDASARHGGPASFPVNRVIPGWTEALQLMKVGAKWQLFIPAELAYGNTPPGPPIQPGSTLVFDIELLGIE